MNSAALIVFGLVTLLGLVSLLPPLAARLKLPYSVLLALAGCALGLLIQLQPRAESAVATDLLTALQQFEISAEAIIVIFLPALLFEAALAVDLRGLIDDIAPILTMAAAAFCTACTFCWKAAPAFTSAPRRPPLLLKPMAVLARISRLLAPQAVSVLSASAFSGSASGVPATSSAVTLSSPSIPSRILAR